MPPLTPFFRYGKHRVDRPFRLFSEDICFYLPRSRNEFYVVVKKNACGIDESMRVLASFSFQACGVCFMQRPPTFVFERLLSLVKIGLTANRVFLITLPRSVKPSFTTKGHDQGVLKRKNY